MHFSRLTGCCNLFKNILGKLLTEAFPFLIRRSTWLLVIQPWNGFVRSPFGDPDLRSPSGFDSGLRPPLRMTRRDGSEMLGAVRSTFGDPDLRSP